MELTGLSFIADERGIVGEKSFRARNVITEQELEPPYASANLEEVDDAVAAEVYAFATFGNSSVEQRADLLRGIASAIEAVTDSLVERAMQETGLAQPRLQGEVGRTCGQLRLFAAVLEEGSWQNLRIDTALPDRKPLARPDLRSMLFPLGPVVVFGASNFPLAFSTAGGDTASALAAGNPVIVKAHPAHPGTSEIVARAIKSAVKQCGLPAGVFSLLYDESFAVGKALVTHAGVQAVAFTGSKRGGRALMDLVAARPSPIPCFTEMSSVNPVFALSGALASEAEAQARGLHASFTLGGGQFCTKPGLIFLPDAPGADVFRDTLISATKTSQSFAMLSSGITEAYHHGLAERHATGIASTAAAAEASSKAHAVLFEADLAEFRHNPVLQEEIFGPSTLLVRWENHAELLEAAEALEGHLISTLLGTEADLLAN